MGTKQTTSGIVRERLTFLLVLLFCTFVSVSEFAVQLDAGSSSSIDVQFDLTGDASDTDSEEGKTFIHAAIDAVVPFALVVVDHAYHFIYEVSGTGNRSLGFDAGFGPPFNQLFEILFEQIISVNAP